MDYKKLYEEALERAKEVYNDIPGYLQNIFPELRESETEDEMIREIIRDVFENHYHNFIWKDGIKTSDVLAWLEKKKNSEEALRYVKENHSPDKVSDFQAAMNIAVAKAYDKGVQDTLEKQKENIEKEYVFRPLAGTDITIAAEQAIRRANEGDSLVLAFNGAYIPVRKGCDANKIVDTYYAYLKKQKEQKPVACQDCAEHLKGYISGRGDAENKLLENFGAIVTPENNELRIQARSKPAEWSEKDKRMLSDIRHLLFDHAFENDGVDVNGDYCKDVYQEADDFLKSLRPHWKPSKEQMEALMLAIEGKCPAPTSYLSRRLEDLYEGLANTYNIECELLEE